jgi:hypothetical protein
MNIIDITSRNRDPTLPLQSRSSSGKTMNFFERNITKVKHYDLISVGLTSFQTILISSHETNILLVFM